MTTAIDGQVDMFELLAEEKGQSVDLSRLTGWTYYETDPDKLDAIHKAWGDAYCGRKGAGWRRFPGWHESMTGRNIAKNSPHPSFTYWADLECRHWIETTVEQRQRGYCQCVGKGMLYRLYCSGCEWWTPTHDGENAAVEAYLDHCWPGWRDLPVLEGKTKGYDYLYTYPDGYPEGFKTPGSPIRDCRGQTKWATRHVPGGSPFGGYKVGVVQECEVHV